MSNFTKVAMLRQVREQCPMLVTLNGEDIALFRRDGEVYAISNVCAHQHFSMIHQGEFQGFEVRCPMHGWKYDIRTGISTTGQGRVAKYNVKIVDDEIFIEMPDPI